MLEENIQDQVGNTTKFLVVTKKGSEHISYAAQKNRITFLFKTDHTPGGLYKCLEVFATHNINLTKIESIPLGI